MLLRHANELLNRLERVITTGHTEISNDELKMWFVKDRISRNVWVDIQDRWDEMSSAYQKEVPCKLLVADHGGTYVFIWGEGLGTTTHSWFKDVRYLAKQTDVEGKEIASLI